MDIKERIDFRNDVQAIYYRLTGTDYSTMDYGLAWKCITDYVRAQGVYGMCGSNAEYINVYYDDPSIDNPQLRCDVCIADPIVKKMQPAGDVGIETITGGKFIVFLMKGAYSQLADFYQEIYGRLDKGDVKVKKEPMFEKYLNDPATTPINDLFTEIWIPIE